MAASDNIKDILDNWGLELVNDLKDSINKYYHDAAGQESALSSSVKYKTINSGGKYTFSLTMNKYWKWANDGREKGKKGVPLSVLGKEWQNKHNIDARKVLMKWSKKKNKKGLNYDKSVKSLAFLIQRSIKKNGIEPRPFYDDVVTPERINILKKKVAESVKEQFIISIKEVD